MGYILKFLHNYDDNNSDNNDNNLAITIAQLFLLNRQAKIAGIDPYTDHVNTVNLALTKNNIQSPSNKENSSALLHNYIYRVNS